MGNLKKLLFIINKHSGKGYEPRVEGKILDACATHHTECVLEFTRERGHARELAKQAVGNFDAVIAVGGDGTVNEAAQGLLNSSTPLGIVPKGSGNGLARHLELPMRYTAAINTLFNCLPVTIDTFTVNDYPGVNVAGIGFDGHIARLFGNRNIRGLWGYCRLVMKDVLRYHAVTATVIADGVPCTSNDFILAFANASQYGNNAWIAPEARLTDQWLNLVQVSQIPTTRLPGFLVKLFTRKLRNNRYYRCQPFRYARVELSAPTPFHVDGEPFGPERSFEICIHPASLQILVPGQQVKKI